MAIRDQTQEALSRVLLEHVRRDPHPSSTQMDILESTMPESVVPDYVNVLLEKVLQDPTPSIPMLRRIQRLSMNM